MVIINGEPAPGAAGMTLRGYLETEGYRADAVVVEQNLVIVPRDRLSEVTISDGDTIEILCFVGGG
ncbi:MAG: sulfur carrier protein ThiS [Oscillospiraceae bacterium]|nr:sulfur carrier protein ThiS [Oscillospiraceae bacterium]